MISAQEARVQTAEQLDTHKREMLARCESFVKAAIVKGKTTAVMYGTKIEDYDAVSNTLTDLGYTVLYKLAANQRDDSSFAISWGDQINKETNSIKR